MSDPIDAGFDELDGGPSGDSNDLDGSLEAGGGRSGTRWGRGLFRIILAVVLALTVGSAVLLQTAKGQRFVVDTVLAQVRGSLQGQMTVGGIRSGTLLASATLTDVRITAAGNRNFLHLDSLRVRYSLLALLSERPRIRSMVLWGLDVEVSQYGAEEELNVLRVLRASTTPDSAGTPEREARAGFEAGTVEVRGGTVEFLTPIAEGQPVARAMPSPDGSGHLRRMAFGELDIILEEVLLVPGDPERILAARLASLSMTAAILEEPLVVRRAVGDFTAGSSGIAIRDGAFRLPSSSLRGELVLGPASPGGAWSFSTSLASDGPGSLDDLRWIEDRIPEGTFEGGADVSFADGIRVDFRSVALELEASRLTLDGGLVYRDELSFDALNLDARPLAIMRLEPWLGIALPLDGFLTGAATFTGTLNDLRVDGRTTLLAAGYPGEPSAVTFRGMFHRGDNPGATGLRVTASPIGYALLGVFLPDLPIRGTGRVSVGVDGRVNQGLRVDFDATHVAASIPRSRLTGRGTLQRTPRGEWLVDLDGSADPLALGLLRDVRPDLELSGVVAGPISARGRLRDLQVHAELDTEGGQFGIDGVVDARSLGSFYRMDIEGRGVALSRLSARLPEPSEWNGLLSIEGRGLAADSMDATATMHWTKSRIGGLHIDTISANLRASQGILTFDSLSAVLGKVAVTGDGRLGLVAPLDGEARLAFATDSLHGLRPLLLGDDVTAKDTLSVMERDFMRLQGIDVDAFPDTADVRMRGSMSGTIRLLGSVDALDIELQMKLRDAVYGPNRVDSATITLDADELPTWDGAWDILADAYGISWQGRNFQFASLDGDMTERVGEAVLAVVRPGGERVDADGSFAWDSLGATVDLRTAAATIDSAAFELVRPTRIGWTTQGSLVIADLEMRRSDDDPMILTASGTLSRADSSDFTLRTDGLHLDRILRLAEVDEWTLAGHTDLELRVTGAATAPRIDATLTVEEPAVGDISLDRLEARLSYLGRDATVHVDAWDGPRVVMTVDGTVPYDLSLAEVEDRSVRRPMDLRIRADSLGAALALAYFSDLEDVAGTVSADVHVGGTTEAPAPEGIIELSDGAWSLEAIGVRHSAVGGTLLLRQDRSVEVDLRTTATGSSTVSGRMVLDPISDPTLDLDITFGAFQAVNRIDIEGFISGNLKLAGRYTRPKITGALRVDRSTLFVDEFVRNATVVDLLDPTLFADTMAFATQPLLRDIRNPFLERLVVDVQLDVPRDTWLRSDEMSVEIGGEELSLLYDRTGGDIVLVGELRALRGSYRVFGRTFNVSQGTVAFMGFPGINPTLDILASTRVRRLNDSDPLNVTANVTGTLILPRVELTTDEAGLVQSDLLSYLLLGRPSSELASGQAAFLNNALGTATTVATTVLSGAVAAQIGSALAQGVGLDYLSISEAGDFGLATGSLAPFANAQVEIGQYLGPDAFFVIVFRPLSNQTPGVSLFGGARLEWSLSDDVVFEGFVEDRFLRSRTTTFGGLGDQGRIIGVFLFREWGR